MARSRRPLSRDRVLEAAVRLADEGGIESLTMRKLARELGVEAMSLYNHVANKADLVDAIVDRVIDEFDLPADEPDPEAAIRRCAISAHDTFLRHPWACNLVITPSGTAAPRAARLRYMEWLLGRLRDAGFSADLTYHAYHVLDAHIVGFTLWELGHAVTARTLAEGQDLDRLVAGWVAKLREDGFVHVADHGQQHLAPPTGKGAFEFGLDLVLDGLRRAADGS